MEKCNHEFKEITRRIPTLFGMKEETAFICLKCNLLRCFNYGLVKFTRTIKD